MKKHTLIITSLENKATICIDDACYPIPTDVHYHRKDIVRALETALCAEAITIADISNIEVDQNDPSFTQSRITIAVANALANAHGIPIRYSGRENQKVLMPQYSGEPHITRKKL